MTHRWLSLAPDAPPPPTLNRKRLEQIAADSSQAFLSEITRSFLSDTETRIALLAGVVGARDAARVVDGAHFLHGAAVSLGVVRLGTLAAALERYATRGDWDKADWAIERISVEVANVRDALGQVGSSVG